MLNICYCHHNSHRMVYFFVCTIPIQCLYIKAYEQLQTCQVFRGPKGRGKPSRSIKYKQYGKTPSSRSTKNPATRSRRLSRPQALIDHVIKRHDFSGSISNHRAAIRPSYPRDTCHAQPSWTNRSFLLVILTSTRDIKHYHVAFNFQMMIVAFKMKVS